MQRHAGKQLIHRLTCYFAHISLVSIAVWLPTLQINVEGAVTVVKHIADSHDSSGLNTGRQEVLYGTHNGVLGQLFLDHQSVKQGWQLKPDQHKGDDLHCFLACLCT